MAEPKRYYWMKLKESFMSSDTIDYFMSQPNGANYVVLYQMLCLKTINTGGRMSRQIGEVSIPFDVEKIQRDCKWFTIDTIRIALNLYKAFGLVYEDTDGTLVLADHKNLVGSESDSASRMRARRETRPSLPVGAVTTDVQPDGVTQSATSGVTMCAHCSHIVTPDIRDKSLDIRDKSLEGKKESTAAAPPTPAQRPSPEMHRHGEYGWVRLTDDQYAKLVKDLGQAELDRCIAYIDESAQGNGNKNRWKDWNLVIRKCSREGWGRNHGGYAQRGNGFDTSNPFLEMLNERRGNR